jgi:hypothetical protein
MPSGNRAQMKVHHGAAARLSQEKNWLVESPTRAELECGDQQDEIAPPNVFPAENVRTASRLGESCFQRLR